MSENRESIIIDIGDGKDNNNDLNNKNNNSPPRGSSIRLDSGVSYGSRLSFIIEDDKNNTITTNENYDIAAKLVEAMRGPNNFSKSIKLRRNVLKDSGRVYFIIID